MWITRHAVHETTPADASADHDLNDRRSAAGRPIAVRIPWTKPPARAAREIVAPAKSKQRSDNRPIRAETRAKLISAIAQGRRWLDELISGTVTSTQEIADRQRCSVRRVNMTISLALLSPSAVPIIKLPTPNRPLGYVKPILRGAPAGLSMHFCSTARFLVSFCNAQLVAFARAADKFAGEGIKVASV